MGWSGPASLFRAKKTIKSQAEIGNVGKNVHKGVKNQKVQPGSELLHNKQVKVLWCCRARKINAIMENKRKHPHKPYLPDIFWCIDAYYVDLRRYCSARKQAHYPSPSLAQVWWANAKSP